MSSIINDNTIQPMEVVEDNLPRENFDNYRNRRIQENVNELVQNFNEHTYDNFCAEKRRGLNDIQYDEYFHSNINYFFEVWRGTVAFLIYRQIQMLPADIPDFPYYDCFVEGHRQDRWHRIFWIICPRLKFVSNNICIFIIEGN